MIQRGLLRFQQLPSFYILIFFLGQTLLPNIMAISTKTQTIYMNMQWRSNIFCYGLIFWTPSLSGQPFIHNDVTGLSVPKRMSRPLIMNILFMIWYYFTTENLAKQNSCTQILLFWYVNRIVEPKAWVSSFSYQWITLFQIFGFSLLLLAHLAHLTIHPHRQLSFSQTEDDGDAHQDCDQQRQHNCPPKHKNCQWKTIKR